MTLFIDPDCLAYDHGIDDGDCPECGARRGEFCHPDCPNCPINQGGDDA